jgi:hypothetical protein
MPLNGVCCVDADNDRHGVGGGCLGLDCDDADPVSYEGGREICDDHDNDCVGRKSESSRYFARSFSNDCASACCICCVVNMRLCHFSPCLST